MTKTPDTVTEAVALLQAEGYTHDFNADITTGNTLCPACSASQAVTELVVEQRFRFEGASDPDDEDIVLGVRCPRCGERGVLTSAFGPDADPAVFAWLNSRPAG